MTLLGWLLLLIIPVLLVLFLRSGTPRLLAARKVVNIFRKLGAVDAEYALTEGELGLKPFHQNENRFISLLFGGVRVKGG